MKTSQGKQAIINTLTVIAILPLIPAIAITWAAYFAFNQNSEDFRSYDVESANN